ncbi:MAG: helix-turn-helix domain-containing protein [Bacteroidota bacterium]
MVKMKLHRVKTISAYHQLLDLPAPAHPLISVITLDSLKQLRTSNEGIQKNLVFDFYLISLKRTSGIKYKYGQQPSDFSEGVMFFMAPNQILRTEIEPHSVVERSGWMLLIHPDFIWNTALAKNIRQYEFFDYFINEALFLSEKEETTIKGIIDNIQREYHSNIDRFSKQIIISHFENLLSYSERFYHRQLITREKTNHQILHRLEKLLTDYFNGNEAATKGLPSVQYIAEQLNVSPKYLSSLLKVLTGQNTQQHIHDKLIEKAKEKLSSTDLSVSEIAYELGFEHLQSFSKLFKAKTKISPVEFRRSFN